MAEASGFPRKPMKHLLPLLLCISAWGQIPVGIIGGSDPPMTPTDAPGAGTYSSTQSVTLADATATYIMYSLSGTPACPATGTLYTGAFNISTTSTLKAIGCIGGEGGGVLTSVYTISASGPTLIAQIAWDSTVSETSSAINCSGANLLVSIGTVWKNWDNTADSVPNGATASDSSSNTWTLVGTQYDDPPGSGVSALWYKSGAAVSSSQTFKIASPNGAQWAGCFAATNGALV
jgi:hypothetical protein